MTAFAAAVQCDFPVGWVDLFAASARLAIGACPHWARCRHPTRSYWLTASKHTMSGVWYIHLKCRESLLCRNDRFWIAARGRGCRAATVRYEPRAAGLKSRPSLAQQTDCRRRSASHAAPQPRKRPFALGAARIGELMTELRGDFNRSTQHFSLFGKMECEA